MLKQSLTGLLVLTSVTAFAHEELDSIEVETQTERAEDQVITEKELRKSSPTDMRSLFKDIPSVSVGGAGASAQKLYVRGVEDTNLNLQVDGARQGGYLFHHQGSLFLEPELIKSVEVRPGVSRADDGFGTMGGTVLVKTKNAFDFASPEHRHGGIVKGTYYSNERYVRPTLGLFTMPTDSFAVLALGTYKDGHSYVAGNGDTVRNTGDKQLSGMLKLSGKGDKYTYDLGHERFEDEGLRIAKQNLGHTDTDLASRQENRRDTLTFNGVYSIDPTYLNLETNLFHTHSKIRRESTTGGKDSRSNARSVGGKLFNTAEMKNNRIKVGADFIRSSSNGTNGEEKEVNTGFFAQDKWNVTKNLNVDFGARFDEHRFTTANGNTFSNRDLSPNARAEYCQSGVCGFAGYSESFRGIKPGEAALITGTIIYPDDIKPESSINREFGASYTYQNHKATLTIFENDLNNLIIYDRRGTGIRTNAGKLTTNGYEASYAFIHPTIVSAKVSYTQMRPGLSGSTDVNQASGIGASLGDSWLLNLSRNWEKYRISYGASFRYVENVNTSTIDKPGFQTYDLWADWSPAKYNDFKFSIYVSNLFDKAFMDHGSFVATGREPLWAPGRDIRLTASYTF